MISNQDIMEITRDVSKYDWTCSGKELGDIIECLKPAMDICLWFGADLDSNNNNVVLEKWMEPTPCEIGTSDDLITLAKGTDQFLGGVFIAMPKGTRPLGDKFYTYNYYYRDLEGITLEIRAFDTTSYLLYSENKKLLELASAAFNTPIKTKAEFEAEVGYAE